MSVADIAGVGPVMLDVAGLELTAEDRERLQHPLVGGVILFARNFQSREQVTELTNAIHALRSSPLLIAVDQEGGRVQRLRSGYTRIAPMRRLGDAWDRDAASARWLSRQTGYVIGCELRCSGIDLSFAPVLDVDHGASTVIGDRAFHGNPVAIAELAAALSAGLGAAGMGAVGKHFPGHGAVRADSHHEVPVDDRPLDAILACDLLPFVSSIRLGLQGIMPAHVIYSAVDASTAGYSPIWLRDILRRQLGFEGVVFSDDLGMAGAATAGGIVERARAAVAAGCDMVLICNDTVQADALLDGWRGAPDPVAMARIARMPRPGAVHGGGSPRDDAGYVTAATAVRTLEQSTRD